MREALADGVRRRSTPATCASGAHGVRARRAPDGMVLLAPACSSFDMFRDYAERGRRVQGGGARRLERDRSGKRATSGEQ